MPDTPERILTRAQVGQALNLFQATRDMVVAEAACKRLSDHDEALRALLLDAERERDVARQQLAEAQATEWRQEQKDALARIHHCDSCLVLVPNEWRSEFQADLCDSCYAAAMAEGWDAADVKDVSALRARVAALEAERDEWKARAFSAEERHRNEMNLHDTQEAMLAAEREALVPLAQLTMDLADAALVLPEELTDAQLAAARAVLAKEGT